MKDQKVLGEERRKLIIDWLKNEKTPLTGSTLAAKTNVSRQVIVQDISLLKARGNPIIATSQGYLYLEEVDTSPKQVERLVVCQHSPDKAKEELNLIVDFGVTVKDVIVEHPVYGDITASIMVSNRKEVNDFMMKIEATNASFLSELTEGVHLHTLLAPNDEVLDKVCKALSDNGYLLHED